MKRILLISDLFYPQNMIGALRPTKIAKALTARGWQVDVFTRYRVDPRELREAGLCANLYGFQDLPGPEPSQAPAGPLGAFKQAVKRNHPALFSKLKKLSDFSYYRGTVRDAREMVRKMQALLPEKSPYDAVFSTFGPLSSLLCGLQYKKQHPETRWICDFRDPMVSKHVPHLFRKQFARYQQEACRRADAIVAVSNGYLQRICQGNYSEKAYMIPNGYDLQDFRPPETGNRSSERFTISYVGALYGGDRDLTPLFKALGELIRENILSPDSLCLAYAGDEPDIFYAQAQKYGVQDLVVNHGILSRKACLDLQFSSHMLVLSTWNDSSDYGVFPGKLLEYMLIGAPIISLTCGALPDGEVTRVIREGRFGVAYEQARFQTDYPALKQYLKEAYLQWKQQGRLSFQPEPQVLDRYNYETIITRIEALLQC